ncbi:MAG: hypothetical protein IKX65_08890 [Prevotella sp.]|nr:hypothetical protein [Prevotella sp.]
MGKYSVISTSTVKYGKYQEVLRVIARKERDFFVTLFFSSNDTQFILSKDSPLAKQVQDTTSGNTLTIDETMFKSSLINGTKYLVELEIDKYESYRERRMEKERKERELKAQKEREIKAKEAREGRRASERKCKSEDKSRLEEAFENATIYEMPFSNLRLFVDENDSFSNQMKAIAGNANMAFIQGDATGFQNSIIELYNKVHGYNSYKLKTIAAEEGQCIGLAFIKMAMYFNNGDFQVNEIAAQNAFYCIVKDFKNTGNTYALPALFTLLMKKPRTLGDELYRVNSDAELTGLGALTPSAPYRRLDRAMSNRLPIMKFLLKKFYNENQGLFIIDTTLPYHIPSAEDVADFQNVYNNSEYAIQKDSFSIGEKYLFGVYDDIVKQLDI